MAVTVKKITVFRAEVDNRTGALARALAGVVAAKGSLDVVMGYRVPGQHERAVIEVWPVSGKKVTQAADTAGLRASDTPTLLVPGVDRPGLGQAMARALADAGIFIAGRVAQVVGRRYSAVFGFESAGEADRAASLLKKAKPGK
ncbi:MAG: hypothetical protein ACHQM7_01745 [Vicinamibacterales bacterium]